MIGTLEKDTYSDLIGQLNIRQESSKLLNRIFSEESHYKVLVEDLLLELDTVKKSNTELILENKNLKERLSLNSQNSSKVPSTDIHKPNKVRTKSEREKSAKKQGGQSGRKGSTLCQKENSDFVIHHEKKECRKCGAKLLAEPVKTTKRQVFEIYEPTIKVIEHQVHHKKCPHCKALNKGKFPDDVKARVQYGIRVKALKLYIFHEKAGNLTNSIYESC